MEHHKCKFNLNFKIQPSLKKCNHLLMLSYKYVYNLFHFTHANMTKANLKLKLIIVSISVFKFL